MWNRHQLWLSRQLDVFTGLLEIVYNIALGIGVSEIGTPTLVAFGAGSFAIKISWNGNLESGFSQTTFGTIVDKAIYRAEISSIDYCICGKRLSLNCSSFCFRIAMQTLLNRRYQHLFIVMLLFDTNSSFFQFIIFLFISYASLRLTLFTFALRSPSHTQFDEWRPNFPRSVRLLLNSHSILIGLQKTIEIERTIRCKTAKTECRTTWITYCTAKLQCYKYKFTH